MSRIEATAKMLEIDGEELFVRAHKVYGLWFPLRPPRDAYSRWKRGLCTEPIYVTKFIERLVATVH